MQTTSSDEVVEEPPVETMDEIFANHKDRWVAIKVTSRDENLQPASGRVLIEDVDRYRLRQKIFELKAAGETCILYAGESEFPLLL